MTHLGRRAPDRTVDLDRLLERTSRTFALSIPLLPEPTRHQVGLAYLLFRIADTFEDATLWSAPEKRAALEGFEALLEDPDPAVAEAPARAWASDPPVDHEGYVELLAGTPGVLLAYAGLEEGARESIRHHVVRTARGMAGFVDRTDEDGRLALEGLRDLRDYCYVVAGIVGEMLTELFLLGRDRLEPVARPLKERAPLFGEGLQLTNILKDSATDAREGRVYLPRSLDRARVLGLAREDLIRAAEYTHILQSAGAEPGLVAFNALPVALARATLDEVEEHGPGAKISRQELWAIVGRVRKDVDEGRPPLASLAPGSVGSDPLG